MIEITLNRVLDGMVIDIWVDGYCWISRHALFAVDDRWYAVVMGQPCPLLFDLVFESVELWHEHYYDRDGNLVYKCMLTLYTRGDYSHMQAPVTRQITLPVHLAM